MISKISLYSPLGFFTWIINVLQPRALTPAECVEALGLQQLKNRKWHVQGAVATRGEGLYEGLDWLALTLKQLNRGQPTR